MQPPQNPYSGYPGPNDPIPPGGSGIPGGSGSLSFDSIGQAWKVLQPNLGAYIGASLIMLVIYAIVEGLIFAMMGRGSNGQMQQSPASGLVSIIGGLIMLFFTAGYIRMAINHLRTGTPQFGDLFSAGDVYLNLVIAYILVGIAVVIGFCFCIIPGILLEGAFIFVFPLIIDKRMGAIDAIQTSFNTMKPHMFMAFAYLFVLSLLAWVGALACVVGILVTSPLALLAYCISYRSFFDNGGTSGFGGPTYPVAPIADPRF